MSATTFGWLILAFPLAGLSLLGLGWRRWPGVSAGWIASLAIALSFGASIGALLGLLGHVPAHRELTSTLWNYDFTVGMNAQVAILVDPLSIFMALVVSGVSTLIHIYSIAYLRADRGYSRYFVYLNYFVFSMLLLIMAANFVLLIVGWAFVGAASYLLISFWYRRTTATSAGVKAFVINVLGDVGLVLGTFFIFRHTHTVDFKAVFAAAPHVFAHNSTDLVAGSLLLLMGAFAKSAQVPLHTWLPDAMEGPTPVSALIHAATMVTAGVYLIARIHPLLEIATTAADVAAIGGCLTLLIAATIAIVQTDLKRIIAYSTMSQIGYMIMGVSVGAYSAGLFHLMSHAFFKALLFMCAGSIIGAMGGEQSLDRMRGFRRAMPFTFACFLVGGLALSGIPPFSGWFSKDDILGYLNNRGGGFLALAIAGYVGAFLTGIYTFRMIFRAFFGEPCEEARVFAQGRQIHHETPYNPMNGEPEDTDVGFPGPEHNTAERAWEMALPMAVLAFLALVGGLIEIPGVDQVLQRFLAPTFAGSHLYDLSGGTGNDWIGLIIGALVGIVGILTAHRVWLARPEIAPALQARLPWLHTFLARKWYFDELIDAAVVRPSQWLGRFAGSVLDRGVIGGGVTGGTTGAVRALSAGVRRAQTGFLRFYAAVMLIGLSGMALYFLISAT